MSWHIITDSGMLHTNPERSLVIHCVVLPSDTIYEKTNLISAALFNLMIQLSIRQISPVGATAFMTRSVISDKESLLSESVQ